MSHLESEKSPYLLQHVNNPVDWYPWSNAVFTRAREENRLIFLSIGYSTCHWCHVMAHECFEDDEVAMLLNADFLSIKVDREERPDIDQVYMEVCQRLTGSGGWPLTIIMTPEARPFYAATYIPKYGRHGRPGMMDLLPWIVNKWHESPDFLSNAADEIVAEMNKGSDAAVGGDFDIGLISGAEHSLKKSFDKRFGGFGRAPKFPRPHDLNFLLQRYRENGTAECLSMVEKTLLGMRCGGIYDHLGGGFHRYSTDELWLVPHFEKMLYDQATLVEAYLGAWQATGKSVYADTVRDVLDYLSRDMLSPQGAYYSAEDADSEGEEGTFYLWTIEEVRATLGPDAEIFCDVYNLKKAGNYHDEVSGKLTGRNILHLSDWNDERSAQQSAARKILFDARAQRIRPHLDDKVIAGWNGMAMSAFARAGKAFSDNGFIDRARDAASFILTSMRLEDGRLLRRFRLGEAAIPAFSEDYAYVARGLLDIYSCDFDTRWLKSSIELARHLIDFFQDPVNGRLYDAPVDGEELLIRPCSTFDGAVPSASSITLEVFGRLFLLTGNPLWRDSADKLMQSLSREISRYPAGYTQLLLSSTWLLQPSRQVLVVGDKNDAEVFAMLDALNGATLSRTVVIYKTSENSEELSSLAPYTDSMGLVGGHAAAYVCQGFTCQRPVTSSADLRDLLEIEPE